MKKYAWGKMAEIILTELAYSGLILFRAMKPFAYPKISDLFGPERDRDYARIQQALSKLQEKNLIRIVKAKDGKFLTITAEGRTAMQKYRFRDLKLKEFHRRWDGLWRVVIFDIPEKKRGIRNAISAKLRHIGFYPLQKSAFIAPYECREEIDFIGNYFNVREHMSYIVSKEVDIDENILSFFEKEIRWRSSKG